MQTSGTVRFWHDEEGWGVIDSDDTPGGCWAHFANVAVPGFRSLGPGQRVNLEWEAAEQDGYHFRATRAWPAGTEPEPDVPPTGSGDAYRSGLSIRFDP